MTGRPKTKYDDKCREWDQFYFLGESPTGAAGRRAGHWQLVYELRPLELIPYWLGIPFRPCHPVYAVIYDDDCPAYYTAPAAKVAELGRPLLVRGTVPFARLLDLSDGVDRWMHTLSDRIGSLVALAVSTANRFVEAVATALATVSGERS